MADVELLPLPELPRQVEGYNSDYWEAGQIEEYAADYARACVEANLAPLQAEVEALRVEVAEWKRVAAAQAELHGEAEARADKLRAEVERLRADRDSWEQQASDRVADWHAEHLRAERLAEALALLPDEIVMVEHNPYEGPLMFCCGRRVTLSWHHGLIPTHGKECWYARMRALRDHDQETKA